MVELEFGLAHIPPSFHRIQTGIFYQTTREPEDRCPSGPRMAWPDGQEWQVQQKRSKCTGQLQGVYPGRGHRRPAAWCHLTAVSVHPEGSVSALDSPLEKIRLKHKRERHCATDV